MKSNRRMNNSFRCFLYNKPKLNRRIVRIRNSLLEVCEFLNPKCKPD